MLTNIFKIQDVLSFFSDTISNVFYIKSGTLLVSLIEDFPFDGTYIPEEGATTTKKVFCAKSEGTLPAYVRAKIIPMVEYYDNTQSCWVVANVAQKDISTDFIADDWIFDGEYYYYKYILFPEETSTYAQINILSINLPNSLIDAKIRLTIKLLLESAQSRNEIWKQIFNISSLPSGVELQ